tara:strand:- start:351 stop:662 length:312 start_codon:yes stop_codon:yes gene_type:complete
MFNLTHEQKVFIANSMYTKLSTYISTPQDKMMYNETLEDLGSPLVTTVFGDQYYIPYIYGNLDKPLYKGAFKECQYKEADKRKLRGYCWFIETNVPPNKEIKP